MLQYRMVNLMRLIKTLVLILIIIIFVFIIFIVKDATAVVQVEDTRLLQGTADNTEEKEIEVMTEIKYGQDIR